MHRKEAQIENQAGRQKGGGKMRKNTSALLFRREKGGTYGKNKKKRK